MKICFIVELLRLTKKLAWGDVSLQGPRLKLQHPNLSPHEIEFLCGSRWSLDFGSFPTNLDWLWWKNSRCCSLFAHANVTWLLRWWAKTIVRFSKCRRNVLGIEICIEEKQGDFKFRGSYCPIHCHQQYVHHFTSTATVKSTAGSTAPGCHVGLSVLIIQESASATQGSINNPSQQNYKTYLWKNTKVFGKVFYWVSLWLNTLSFADYPIAASHLQIANIKTVCWANTIKIFRVQKKKCEVESKSVGGQWVWKKVGGLSAVELHYFPDSSW